MAATSSTPSYDCLVVGAGPAGCALANALHRRGLRTAIASPRTRWLPTYGVWCDEFHALPYSIPYAETWDAATVSMGADFFRLLPHAYGRIDNAALPLFFLSPLEAASAVIRSAVTSVEFSPPFFSVHFRSHGPVTARFVFDATGHEHVFCHRPLGDPAYQVALGFRVEGDLASRSLSSKTMGLMLWDDGLVVSCGGVRYPAFVYVMPESDEIAFAEITVLASRPVLKPDALRETLDGWLVANGLKRVSGDEREERVLIPMGHELPGRDQPIIGIGGAASEVHPATGYMVGRSLHTAERLADRVAEVGEGAWEPTVLWDAVWTGDERRCHALHRLGLESVLAMEPGQVREFFGAFFELPEEQWRGYLSRTLTPSELMEVMWALFKELGPGLKVKLGATAVGRGSSHLLDGLFRG